MPTKYQVSVSVLALLFIAGGVFVYSMSYLGKANALKKLGGETNFAALSPLRYGQPGQSGGDANGAKTGTSPAKKESAVIGSSKSSGGGALEKAGEKGGGNAGDSVWPEGIPKTKININTASIDLLDKLPGIGPKIAETIVRYREDNGFFEKPEDLINVKGIGEKKLAKLLPYIRVD